MTQCCDKGASKGNAGKTSFRLTNPMLGVGLIGWLTGTVINNLRIDIDLQQVVSWTVFVQHHQPTSDSRVSDGGHSTAMGGRSDTK